eukprot:1136828-Amphidinium_carterae.1
MAILANQKYKNKWTQGFSIQTIEGKPQNHKDNGPAQLKVNGPEKDISPLHDYCHECRLTTRR